MLHRRVYNSKVEKGEINSTYEEWLEMRLDQEIESRRNYSSDVEYFQQLLIENDIEFDTED